jgi:hypothetical protein
MVSNLTSLSIMFKFQSFSVVHLSRLLFSRTDLQIHAFILQVVRVKNRLTRFHNSAQSAGYRDIAINLRLSTPEAHRLGVASHVCEVQIILKAFADLKVVSIPRAKLLFLLQISHKLVLINTFSSSDKLFYYQFVLQKKMFSTC